MDFRARSTIHRDPPHTPRQVKANFVHVSSNGDVFFCDYTTGPYRIRVLRMSGPDAGRVFDVAGNGSSSRAIEGALSTQAGVSGPYDVCAMSSGDVLIAENDHGVHPRILRVSGTDGLVRVIAGNASLNWEVYFDNGTGALAVSLFAVTAVCADDTRNIIYFAEYYRVVSLVNCVLYVLGGHPGITTLNVDGEPAAVWGAAALWGLRLRATPEHLIITSSSDLTVYRMNLSSSRVYAEAGHRFTTPMTPKAVDGMLATEVSLVHPTDVAFDPISGDLFTTVQARNVVLRVFSQNGTVKVVAGNGMVGVVNNESTSDATSVPLAQPSSLVLDGRVGLVVADWYNCLILRIDLEVRRAIVSMWGGCVICVLNVTHLVRMRRPGLCE